MTATLPERPDVVEASESDLRIALQRALAHAGLSFDELARQARTGRFESVRARMAWTAIGDLGGLAGGKSGGAVQPGEGGSNPR